MVYEIRAPKGPAEATDPPEDKKIPVPMVPIIFSQRVIMLCCVVSLSELMRSKRIGYLRWQSSGDGETLNLS